MPEPTHSINRWTIKHLMALKRSLSYSPKQKGQPSFTQRQTIKKKHCQIHVESRPINEIAVATKSARKR